MHLHVPCSAVMHACDHHKHVTSACWAQLAKGYDADQLLLDEKSLELRYVIARGVVLRRAQPRCSRSTTPVLWLCASTSLALAVTQL